MPLSMLALDVSSQTLEGCHPLEGKPFEKGPSFLNHPEGIAEAVAWAKRHGAWIVVEATGAYHLALVMAAQEAGLNVSVLNPSAVRTFAKALGYRSKTDPLDARAILRCARAMQEDGRLVPARPLDPDLLRLRTLLRQRDLLVEPRAAMNLAGISRTLVGHMDAEIRNLDTAIRQACRVKDALYRRLRKIPFVGPVSAAYLLALFWDPSAFASAGAAVAYVGLDVRLRESGRYKGKCRLSKGGWAALRKALVAGLKSAGSVRLRNPVADVPRISDAGEEPAPLGRGRLRRGPQACPNRLVPRRPPHRLRSRTMGKKSASAPKPLTANIGISPCKWGEAP